jgi:hypothetical protein
VLEPPPLQPIRLRTKTPAINWQLFLIVLNI